jgi:hypothetical protein
VPSDSIVTGCGTMLITPKQLLTAEDELIEASI